MSLFVGNVSRFGSEKDIENAFREFGQCKIEFRNRFAFVQYEKDKDAENAKNELNNMDFGGLRLNIEWSKKSGRFQENEYQGGRGRDDRGPGGYDRGRRRSMDRGGRWSRSRSRDRRNRLRDSPKYRRSRSVSSDKETDCPRDKILKKQLKEYQNQKKEKKRLEKEKKEKEKQEKLEKEKQKKEKEDKKKKDKEELEKLKQMDKERQSSKEKQQTTQEEQQETGGIEPPNPSADQQQ